jgi:CheY-like chemotaxis protein
MLILYGDDEQIVRDLVTKALTARGHTVFGLDTSRAEDMGGRLKKLNEEHGTPDIFILDGHNILVDKAGNQLYDMTPLGLVAWLRENGVPGSCKFILYSNDDKMVEQARSNRHLQFFDAVPKGGEQGGLLALIRAVEQAAKSGVR